MLLMLLELLSDHQEGHPQVSVPALRVEDDSPNGEGSMLRYFLGDEEDDEGGTGIHLRLFGDVGLIKGSKSIVLFRVAPHAMTSVLSKGEGGEWVQIPKQDINETVSPVI